MHTEREPPASSPNLPPAHWSRFGCVSAERLQDTRIYLGLQGGRFRVCPYTEPHAEQEHSRVF